MSETEDYHVSVQNGRLTAPFVLEYDYKRATGPIIGDFLTGLRDKKILAAKTRRGPVICPPQEYDPETGEDIESLVEIEETGTLTSFAVVHEPLPSHLKDTPFAFVLVKLDGADNAMAHILLADDWTEVRSGARVRAVFADQRKGFITDIDHFVLEGAS